MSKFEGGKDLSLKDIIQSLHRSRWLIFCITFCFVAGAAVAILVVPEEYEASALLSVVSRNDSGKLSGGLGALASQFGGLAELAGVSAQAGSGRADTVAVLQSEILTEDYLQKNDLLPVLFPGKWDPVKHAWKHPGTRDTPTLWKGNRMFRREIRAVVLDAKTGLVTLTITWKDPITAARWANDLVKLTNEYLRDKAIRESEINIAYLKDEASRTEVLGVKQGIFALMQKAIGEQMLARGNQEYALKVLDPAVAPEKPTSPRPVLWLTLGFIGGLFVAIAVATVRNH